MTSHKRVAQADDPDTALLKAIALDIGKDVVAYIEWMFPQAVSATSSSFRLSVRNDIYNNIMSWRDVADPDAVKARLAVNEKHRREMRRMRKVSNETDWESARQKIADGMDWRDVLNPQDIASDDDI